MLATNAAKRITHRYREILSSGTKIPRFSTQASWNLYLCLPSPGVPVGQ
jgi:hypothetical protein